MNSNVGKDQKTKGNNQQQQKTPITHNIHTITIAFCMSITNIRTQWKERVFSW